MQRFSQIGILLVVILVPIFLISFYLLQEEKPFSVGGETVGEDIVRIGSARISVEVVESSEERKLGLSNRNELSANEGMLFVFEEVGAHGIWMRNMKFPIDIVWISEDLYVVDIKKRATPDSYPNIFYPKENARYVLEVNDRFTEVWNIGIGDKVSIPKKFIAE
jgi:uncharacterized membrane protein (UPF0127 family)